jgi:phosphoribosylformylglycinamidine cyclo-ligase
LQRSSKLSAELKKKQKNVISGIGGFAALYRAKFPQMKEPTLVTCTDGVGTKVLLASQFRSFQGVGQDLVAMCVNDLICTGGEPLFFLDYYACGKLHLEHAKEFLHGVRQACAESGALLLGGETAEMPGVYQEDHFDCAGFAVGVVDAKKVLGSHRVKVGDRLIGVASSGFHSNGYSLLRRVFADDVELWKEELLRPTALYVGLARSLRKIKGLKAMANITGGGMDNISRVLPERTCAVLTAWAVPAPFLEVKKRARISWIEMLTTLNCGLGLVAVVAEKDAAATLKLINKQGHKAWDLGRVEKQSKKEPAWVFAEQDMEGKNRGI